MRIDKFLKNARIIKRRTIAKEACEQGRVSINGKVAKPGDEVKVGDRVQIAFGTEPMNFEILNISDNVKKDDALGLYKKIE
ncbi:RNA-binding S4 domain-containing protein [Tissierella pigra]|uniref:RQC P-site tRNA stabilizing factor n=1 Tax=Tissierella pigra TaxID=2607614 RepID=A0A6N7XG65_9FIRM|nr:RNA-binding S4 domain-containing protein [Tissierella pigra]MBU5425502.1 RNA-binding S4 domain-containing protein [Tissierella pigra]MSU01041.1 RNA-binding S4 domain-containing protein [Tissierella pigra]